MEKPFEFRPSASAIGQEAAFATQADDPSAIHYNLAGIMQLRGFQFYVGTTLISDETTLNSFFTGNMVKGDFGGTISNSPPPNQLYLTANLQDLDLDLLKDWSMGIGVTAPFGINIEYPMTSQVAPTLDQSQPSIN